MSVVGITSTILDITAWAFPITGLLALLALFSRTRLSKFLGWISIGCVVTAFIALAFNWGKVPGVFEFARFILFAMPGAFAIVFNRAPRGKPGHCVTCGYNLTGNVSGKCSECGEPVPAT